MACNDLSDDRWAVPNLWHLWVVDGKFSLGAKAKPARRKVGMLGTKPLTPDSPRQQSPSPSQEEESSIQTCNKVGYKPPETQQYRPEH